MLATRADCAEAVSTVIAATADGTLTLHDAHRLFALIEGHRKAAEVEELERRMAALERAAARDGSASRGMR